MLIFSFIQCTEKGHYANKCPNKAVQKNQNFQQGPQFGQQMGYQQQQQFQQFQQGGPQYGRMH